MRFGHDRRSMNMDALSLDLTGRVAVVTGASRRQGIGAAVCRALARHGADIFFTHWQPYDQTQSHGADPDGPEALQQELNGFGVRTESLEIDLAQADAPVRVMNVVEERLGAPSILVNNAAHS